MTRKKLSNLSAKDYAVFLLSLQIQSEGMLRAKLLKKKYSKEDIEDAIAYLKELRYLNDSEYAATYFENLKKYKNLGFYGIKKKLIEKKISAKDVEKTMKGMTLKEEREIAQRLLTKYARKTPEQRMAALRSRGFRSEVIFKTTKIDPEIS